MGNKHLTDHYLHSIGFAKDGYQYINFEMNPELIEDMIGYIENKYEKNEREITIELNPFNL